MGGGIVGAAAFLKLQRRHPEARIALLEKEDILSDHQTGHNSGVIHSGLYYPPGSLKAINCVKGRHELVAFAKEYGVEHDICGKVVAAATADEVPMLEKVFGLGLQNEIEGLERISGDAVREIEPHVRAVEGLWVPCTGIIDFRGATAKMVDVARGIQPESAVFTGVEARNFTQDANSGSGSPHLPKVTVRRQWRTRRLCRPSGRPSGAQGRRHSCPNAWSVSAAITTSSKTTPSFKVRNLIYPVPDPQFPFLGCSLHADDQRRHRMWPQRRLHLQARGIWQNRLQPSRHLRSTGLQWHMEAVLEEHVIWHQ